MLKQLKQYIKQKVAEYNERQKHNDILAKKMYLHVRLHWKSNIYTSWKSGCHCDVCHIIRTLPHVRGKLFDISVKDSEDKITVWIRPKYPMYGRSSTFITELIKAEGDVKAMRLDEIEE